MLDDKKTVLVTGGAGFLGSFLCERLLKDARVICIDDFSTAVQSNINHLLQNPDFEFIKADINEPIDLEAMPELARFQLGVFGVQEIYNLACPNTHDDFDRLRQKTLLANSFGVKNMLDLAVKYRAKFFQASSSIVYGQYPEGVTELREDTLWEIKHTEARACYDEGKRFAETVCSTYRDVYGLDIKIGRLFWLYGPRQSLRDGHLVQDFIIKAIEGGDLTIYGDENTSVAMLYVTDAVSAMVELMDSDVQEPVNIGSNQSVRIKDIAEKIIELVGNEKAVVEYRPAAGHNQVKALPNLDKISSVGWAPVVTLENGLKKTIEYVVAHKDIIGPYFG